MQDSFKKVKMLLIIKDKESDYMKKASVVFFTIISSFTARIKKNDN